MRHSILIIAIFLLFSSCETTIEFSDQMNIERKFSIHALANEGSPFYAYINNAIVLNQDIGFEIDDAIVELTINNKDTYRLVYAPNGKSYFWDIWGGKKCYIPSIGDHIEINVSHSQVEKASAETRILEKASYEIIEHKTMFKKNPLRVDNGIHIPIDGYGIDSIMLIKAKITDNISEKSYYRLNVRSIGSYSNRPHTVGEPAAATDIFTSNDPIFFDPNITKEIDNLPMYFSTVFDDTIFNGEEYLLTIETRKRNAPYCWVEFDLEHISEDLYKYLKFIESYKCSENDIFAEPIKAYTNVKGGWGILGSMTSNKSILDF